MNGPSVVGFFFICLAKEAGGSQNHPDILFKPGGGGSRELCLLKKKKNVKAAEPGGINDILDSRPLHTF